MVNNGEIVGDLMLGMFVAKKIHDRYETKQAAKSEGISYEEMRLRENAARYRSKAAASRWPRRQQKYAARASACDEQLARFEETRRIATTANQESNQNQGVNQNTHYCEQCGAARIEGARFCGECGTKVTVTSQQKQLYSSNNAALPIVKGSPIMPNQSITAYNPNYRPVEYSY